VTILLESLRMPPTKRIISKMMLVMSHNGSFFRRFASKPVMNHNYFNTSTDKSQSTYIYHVSKHQATNYFASWFNPKLVMCVGCNFTPNLMVIMTHNMFQSHRTKEEKTFLCEFFSKVSIFL
jgi:hypothetical protein